MKRSYICFVISIGIVVLVLLGALEAKPHCCALSQAGATERCERAPPGAAETRTLQTESVPPMVAFNLPTQLRRGWSRDKGLWATRLGSRKDAPLLLVRQRLHGHLDKQFRAYIA
jgi:hypothetical protein